MAKVIRFDVPVVFRLQEDTDCFYDHKPSWKFYEPCTRCTLQAISFALATLCDHGRTRVNAFQTISNNSKVNFFPQKLKK